MLIVIKENRVLPPVYRKSFLIAELIKHNRGHVFYFESLKRRRKRRHLQICMWRTKFKAQTVKIIFINRRKPCYNK